MAVISSCRNTKINYRSYNFLLSDILRENGYFENVTKGISIFETNSIIVLQVVHNLLKYQSIISLRF